jgi:transglutaminase-like putative cysteine protease
MRLVITHETVYRYAQPVNYSIQHIRLTPLSDASQTILNWRLDCPARTYEQTDTFGNIMHVLVIDSAHQEIRIQVTGEAETTDNLGVLADGADVLPREVFRRPTPLTAPDAAIRNFSRPLSASFEKDALDGLHALSRAVGEAIEYRGGATDVESTAAEVLAQGFGVCQDQTHLFLAAARLLGAPARYVSGYVHVENVDEVQTASHAWAAAWVADLGWVSFDVTNAVCPTDAHLRLAVGLDYLGCAPLRGIRRGGGDETMRVEVEVHQ